MLKRESWLVDLWGNMNFAEVLLTNRGLVRVSDIVYLDLVRIEKGEVVIMTRDGMEHLVTGFAALELIYSLHPSALEGKNLRWAKYAWAVHNLIAHPVMQLLAFVGLYKWALWVHNVTVPKPLGVKGE